MVFSLLANSPVGEGARSCQLSYMESLLLHAPTACAYSEHFIYIAALHSVDNSTIYMERSRTAIYIEDSVWACAQICLVFVTLTRDTISMSKELIQL